MGAEPDEARVELEAQRARVRATAEQLNADVRHALDLKAKVRENPVQTVALAAGVAFFLFGGPRRTFRWLRHAVRGPGDGARAYAALPGALRELVDASAPGHGLAREEARQKLALALHAWREDPRNRKRAERLAGEALTPPGPERAFWAFAEIVAITAAGIVARRVVAKNLMQGIAALPRRPGSAPGAPAEATAPPPAVPPAASRQYSGWSGQRPTTAGPAATSTSAKPAAGAAPAGAPTSSSDPATPA